MILLAIAGWVVGATAAYTLIGEQLRSLFGPSTANILLGAVRSSKHAQGVIATVVSVGTLFISATTVLAALQNALQHIWKTTAIAPTGFKGWIRTRFLSLGFILALGFLLLVSLTISTGLSNLRSRIVGENAVLVGAVGAIGWLLSLALVAVLFALIFRYMPARRLHWKIVAGGGALTAVLFDLGRWIIGVYLARSTQPTAFGAAASFAALLLWFYYTAQIFLFGAEFTACLGGLRTERSRP